MLSVRIATVAFVAVSAFAQVAAPVKTHLKVGDAAPDITLNSTTGKVKLSDFKGKNTVVLAFFPAAFTGGCTKEMQAYQASVSKFTESNAKVFGVSTDNLPTLRHWNEEHLKSEVPLASDFMREAAKAYGVLNTNTGTANRTTFVIDADGKIQHLEEGNAAVDISGAVTACSRLKK